MENQELKNLIVSNQNLIYSIVNKFRGDKEDLFQAGCLGLIDAYKKYNPSYEVKFTTYAYPFIYGEIYKFATSNKNIKVSPDIIKLNMAITKAEDYLTQKYKRPPTDIEIANFLEIPIYKIVEARNVLSTISLDDERDNNNLYDFISFENTSKDDLILLRDAINNLEKKEKELILKRYFYNMTQGQIAKENGINQVKVSREEGKVLTKLRNYIN